MNQVGIVIKSGSEKAGQAAARLKAWLAARGIQAHCLEPDLSDSQAAFHAPEAAPFAPETEMIIVLGGDGTLLYAARALRETNAPLLGVNLGGLGFLTEISQEDLYGVLKKILKGDFETEPRMMLDIEVVRQGQLVARQTVLNDAVINKAVMARILDLKVFVNNRPLAAYRSDGLIIATPTGSTAYNLSAGGPIVHPAQKTMILTPICPFTLGNRPLTLPETAVIEVRVDPKAQDMVLTADGQVYLKLDAGDAVRLKKSSSVVRLIKNPYRDYFEILRTKLGWG